MTQEEAMLGGHSPVTGIPVVLSFEERRTIGTALAFMLENYGPDDNAKALMSRFYRIDHPRIDHPRKDQ